MYVNNMVKKKQNKVSVLFGSPSFNGKNQQSRKVKENIENVGDDSGMQQIREEREIEVLGTGATLNRVVRGGFTRG